MSPFGRGLTICAVGQCSVVVPRTGERRLEGRALERERLRAAFPAAPRWRELYPRTELVGMKKILGHSCYVVQLTSGSGESIVHYYDSGSFLLLRSQDDLQTIDYSDYKPVAGIRIPFTTVKRTATDVNTLRVKQAIANREMDDSLFVP